MTVSRVPRKSLRAGSMPGRLAAALAVLLAGAALTVLPATAARADCPINSPDCGGPVEHTYSSTLTVNTQNVGTVTSSPAGIACPGDCTQTDEVIIPGTIRPTLGWPTYTLTATDGPPGATPAWYGCDSEDSAHRCIVTNDDETTQVSLGWFDLTPPTIGSLVPVDDATVGRTVTAQVAASDGSGIKEVRFIVDNVLKATDTAAPFTATLDMSGFASGTRHFVSAQAVDNNGLTTQVNHTVTVDTSTEVSFGDLPGVVNTVDPVTVAVVTDDDATAVCGTYDASNNPLDGLASCTGNYTLPFTPQTPDGSYQARVLATDAVGNTALATKDVVVDNTAPSLDISGAPVDGGTVHGSALGLTVTSTDPHGVHLTCQYDGANVPCSSGDELSLTVTPGPHTFVASTYDDATNDRALTVHFTGAAVDPGGTVTNPVHHGKRATKLTAHAAHKKVKRHKRIRLTASVKPAGATGKVVFKRGKHTLCTAKVRHGKATCRTKRLKHGSFHVVARYLGSNGYLAAKARFTFRVR